MNHYSLMHRVIGRGEGAPDRPSPGHQPKGLHAHLGDDDSGGITVFQYGYIGMDELFWAQAGLSLAQFGGKVVMPT